MMLRVSFGLAFAFFSGFSANASPQSASRGNPAELLRATESNPLQQKPPPNDPLYYNDFPVRGDLVKFSHYGAPLSFEVVAEASFDGVWEAFRLAKGGWKINVPNEEFKRTTPNFQLDIGSDLYSESNFALHDLALLINLIFGWGKYYQPREFQVQWFKQGKPYVMGTLRKGSRLASSSTNVTATA